ncbi:amino acid adenylation domain-containing protein, partial [Corallococcus sp. AB032C]
LGRVDFQVKVRGFRVEPEEVATVLRTLPSVHEAVVVARQDAPGEARLVAYVVADASGASVLRESLKQRLPEYMVPSAFLFLDALPLTPNGKVDRKALPTPDASASNSDYVAPRTPTEELLASVWAEVLRLPRVGAQDHFFELGGHSLLATQLVARVRAAFGVDLPLRSVFEAPSLADLARRIDDAGKQASGIQAPPLVRAPRTEALPLSFAQQRLWFMDQLVPGASTYNVPSILRLEGELHLEALRHSLTELVRRHEALRTRFPSHQGQPFQRIVSPTDLPLPMVDLSPLGEAALDEARRLASTEAQRSFDLASGPLVRALLLKLAPTEHVLVFTLHHIVSDGWSRGVLVREVATLYAAFSEGLPSPLRELPVQYADYAVWQRSWLQGDVLDAQLDYWRQHLADAAPLELPIDFPRPAVQSSHGGMQPLRLPLPLAGALKALAQREAVTPFMLLMAAFQVLLSRYSGQEDISVGSPIAGRTHAETEGLIGFFVNTLVLRSHVASKASFRQLLQQVREAALGAYAHQDVPFERLVEELRPQRDLTRPPLFQALFALQNTSMPSLQVPGLALRGLELEGHNVKAELELFISESSDGFDGSLGFNTALFAPTTAQRMARHFVSLVEALVAHPEAPLASAAMLSQDELHQLLVQWNDTRSPFPHETSIHQRFADQARERPDALAVLFGDDALTYRQLDERANQLAHALIGLGVHPGTLVALGLGRSLDLIVAILGVLKAGAAYVPLEMSYPHERLAMLLEDSGAPVLVTRSDWEQSLPSFFGSSLLMDDDAPLLARKPTHAPAVPASADSLAYVMFTSGSTGRPKGVMVPHRGVVRLVCGASYFRFGPEHRYSQLAPTAFDASTMEIWSALLHGAQLVLAPPHSLSLEELAAFFRRHAPTSVVLTTALFEQMALHQGDTLARVSQLMIGGDVMPAERARQHLAKLAPGSVLINGYGPTENTTASTAHIMGPASPVGHAVPIGKPIGQSTVYVLDTHQRPVPVGVAGELFVGGAGLAWGYLRRPDLTAERFVPNAFTSSPGERLYRTGDRARWRADGSLEFLGRTDFQVKVRGFRIEPGEVESALQRLPGVAETLVMAREDVPGDKRLVAYVATGGLAMDAAALRAHLQQQLPGHMVPTAFVVMEALPLTPNGKVDRKALPVPDASVQERGRYMPPSTPTEELLASLWTELLRVDRIGREDDFFEVGGHSLLGTQLVSRIRTTFGIELPLRALFEAPTLTRLALRVEEALRATEGSALPPPRAVDRGDEAPLSFAQQRLWFLEQLQPGTATYNIPSALHLDGPLDLAALERAFRELLQRHESLRTTLHAHAGEPVQRFHATAEFTLDVQDLEHLAPDAREAEARRLAGAEGLRPFDLARSPLLRASLLRLAEHRHMLLVTMHHIVSDGWSMSILVRELDALYRAFRQGLGSPLAALPLQYADYALWQRDWLQGDALERQRAWWRQHLAGAPRALELSTDFPRPAVQSFRGASVPFLLPPELSHALQTLAQQHGATLFMALLASTQTLLARHSGQDDVVIGSPIAGRRFAELEGLIGFFINTLALRSRLDDAPTFVQLLGRMREATLGAYAHQDIPFEKLVEELQPQRDLSRSPLFQVMLMVQNAPRAAEGARPDTLTLRPVAQDSGTSAKFDLTFVFTHSPQGLVGSVTYSTALFREESIRRLVGHLRVLLEAVVLAPDTRVHDLPLLPREEREQVLLAWNDTARPFDATNAHARFEAQALRTPDAVALVSGEDRLTYRELHQRVLRLSRRLQARGVRPDEPVALCARRAPDMVVAMLAILHAGGAYLPLDPDYPADRLTWMLRDSQARVLVTQQSLRDAVPADGLDVVFMEETGDGEAAHAPGAALPGTRAYVIYTSGSTGRPKGVMVPHHTLSHFLEAMDAVLGTSTPGTWLAVTSISFDIHVLELLWTLTRGFQVVLHDEKAAARGAAPPLARLLRQHAITHLQCTPAFARSLVLAPDAVSSLGTLRHLLVGGEALPGALAVQLRDALPAAVLRNMYGPTETTVWSSTHAVTGDAQPATLSIGAPIANTRLYVLDARGQPVPVGVPGELFIAGDGVVRGYLARPELTAERFVPDAFSGLPGSRMYRTGDLARWRSDGTLDFLGRTDFQLKVRGFRIEPGEVEAILVRHPSVLQAVAGARPDTSGDGRLVAWVVLHDGQALEPAALRDFARQHLPEHLVPSLFMALDTFPLTPNGKVDRKALPVPDAPASAVGYIAPRTPTEEKLAALFAQVLRVPRVGATDHFFELGGHSLLATQLVSRVRVAFDVELPLQALFETPTVAEVAARIDAALQSGQLAVAPPLQRAPSDQPLPASYSQHRVWLLDQLAPGGAAFNMPLALRLSGALDVEALRRALEALVHRHESLRTTFRATSEGPIQVIAPPGPLALAPIDLRSLPADAREAEVQRRSDAEAQRPFDLATGPLLRVALLALDAREHVLLLTLHHIISDGWSMSVMVREVVELYRAFATQTPAALAPLPLQFGDYAAWQRQWLQGDVLEAQLSWWRRQLDGAPRALELPTDRPRAPHTSLRAEVLPVEFPLALSEAVEALCRREGITPFMFLLAAFQLLLARYSGQDDISVGSPVAGRNRAELEGLIGFFLNTLVLRTRLDGDPTVRELLARVRTTALDAFAHQHVPFEQLQPMRDLHQAPLFQVMFILQNTPPAELSVPGLTFRALPSRSRAAKFDMTLSLSRTARGFVGALEYAKDFYDASTAERLMRHLHVLVKALVATPERRLSELALLTGAERSQVLVDWNPTREDFPDTCVHTLFEAQVRRAPTARAATFEGTHLTYAELDARANQVAHALRRRGVGPEVRVALSLERSLDVVIGLLGILKAGGAWVPVDPLLPRERRAFMLEDSGAQVLLTQEILRDRFPEPHRTSALCLDAERDAIASEPTDAPASGVTSRHLAYLLYTSGSTGLPKGTLVEHRSVANLVTHEAMAYGIGPSDRVLQFANLSFDLSVEEIFTTLCAGATLVLAPMEKLMPGAPLQQLLREEALTVISLTPAALAATPADGLPSLRTVISGGEALPAEVVARWASGRRLINTYGPTEATVVATLTDCVADGRVPAIGKPLANVHAYVLDARGEPVPVGVRGELYLGGVGVARGYAGRPALTAERFVPDAFSGDAGARLYRTGDVVRWREDGTLEFVGRGDAQVKVRGFRIELGEVEAVLRAAPTVKDAVVLVREDVPGDRRLVAYVVADAPDVSVLREHLKQHLPEYMVPAAFVALPALPLTANGKVDRKALPAPDFTGDDREHVPPRTDTEERLAGLWRPLLGVTRVGATDSFFDLGGHSLLATQAISRIREAFGVELPLRALFDAPTVEGLSARIDAALEGRGVLAPSRRREGPALSVPLLPLEEIAAREVARPAPVEPGDDSAGARPLTDAERQQVLVDWNATATDFPRDATLHSLIEAQVERTPDAVALAFEGRTLTYRELDARANQLAHALIARGVGPEVRVGLLLERSLELVVALLATLKAGGAYVPFDPAYPAQRLAWMLEDARPAVLLAQEHLLSRLPAHDARVLCLDTQWDDVALQPRHAPPPRASADGLAYVIFTSGSTGRPKGAMNAHGPVVNRLLWMQSAYALGPADVVLQKTPFSFDVSVWEFFWPLMTGARLVLAKPGGHQDPAYLARLVAEAGVTTLHFVPSMLQVFLEEPALESCTSLRRVVCSGEALPLELAERCLRRLPWAGLHNLYGPTEAAVDVTFHQCLPGESRRSVPIGRPVANTQIRILDAHLHPVPVGVPGELFIGGVQVGRGYLGRPELTAERFIPDGFSDTPGSRLYRTGDVARWLPDGAIEYVGRADFQVKVRGLRIELGEIEATLEQHPGVRQSVVVAREDAAGDKRLVAYVVRSSSSEAVEVGTLRSRLYEKLPEYMVPSAFVLLDSLPLTPSGKVDRKALPAPATSQARVPTRAPRTDTERDLAALWSRVLRINEVGADDDFFDLGGHSLSATQVLARVRQHFGVELSLPDFFAIPTVEAVARRIDALALDRPAATVPPLRARPSQGPAPLSFAQQRLWFLSKLDPDSANYNLPTAVRLEGPLDVAALTRALRDVLQRHESLRTTLQEQGHQPVQVIAPEPLLPAVWADVSGLPDSEREAALQRLVEHEAWRPFDLAAGPLWRVLLVRLTETQHALLVTLHHVISDGWSMGVLVQELTTLYTAHAQSRPTSLEPLAVQYPDFALWQREWLRDEVLEAQLGWWRERLQGAPRTLELPTDRPRPATPTLQGGAYAFQFPVELTEAIQALCRKEGVTPSMVVLAAFQLLLSRYSGQEDISVGSPIAGRTHAELEGLIGFFVNTLVLRTNLAGVASFRALLARVRDVTLGAYAHQDVPFEKLVEALRPERIAGRAPLFQVLIVYQNAPTPEVLGPGLRMAPLRIEQRASKFDLSLSVSDRGQGLRGALEYSTDLFDASTAERMMGHLRVLLEGALANPDHPLRALPLLTAGERQLLFHAWRDPSAATAKDAGLHRLIEAQSRLTPEAVAMEMDGESLTWAEAHRRAREVYRSLVVQRKVELPAPPPLVPVPRTGLLPLSFAQQRLWFIDQLEPGTATYNIPFALRVQGALDVPALGQAFHALLHRHEALRTTFVVRDAEPFQEIHPAGDFHLTLVDLGALPVAEREAEAQGRAATEAARPFDLARGPLLRASLIRMDAREHVLLMTMHHIVSDGWSMDVLVREVAGLYGSFVQGRSSLLPKLPVQYADFAVWQRTWLQGEVLEAQLGYWKQQLSGAPALLELPTDKPRPAVQSQRGASLPVHLPLSQTLTDF